jgi:PadR family transcriptional regulator PadR
MSFLSKADELILLIILRLKDNAYGVTIRQRIEKETKKLYGYGTLYSALDQLQRKEYVNKTIGEPSPERGGRSKKFYTLTKKGLEALKYEQKLRNSLWDGVTEAMLQNIQ